jgi:zinc transporter ZupT
MDSTLLILGLSTAAAAAAALGALPLMGRRSLPDSSLGWANALAAGMMLGAAYLLTTVQPEGGAVAAALGAALGVFFILGTHHVAGTEDQSLNRMREDDPAYGYQILFINGLHGASEGVAIGLAMVVDIELGIFMALAIALHNIPEATVLCAILRSRGVRLDQAAGLAIATNIGQVLLAVTIFSVVTAAPSALPWALGFAVGSLLQLVLMELLPESYRQAGQTSIAMVTVVTLGVVVLAKGLIP